MGLEDRMEPAGRTSLGRTKTGAHSHDGDAESRRSCCLLDEHTAALDPGTAEKVLELTTRIVAENRITCLMITHNMESALELGTPHP